ncbi:MAG TPA: pilus assembly protein N-terminal domain-containing protein, partial [Methylophilaceae bacterium]|nr:pilus assembly protein N-terminal domain-containing protein [Methylophilaceae bacterium]
MNKIFWIAYGLLASLPHVAQTAELNTVALSMGKQQTYTHPAAIKRIAVANPAIAGITVVTKNSLLITAKQVGATDISIWENEREVEAPKIVRVMVEGDASVAEHRLDAIEADQLSVSSAGDGLVLSGQFESLDEHAAAKQAIEGDPKELVDLSAADFDNQVQIDIKVVEVSRQSMMRAGFFLGRNRDNRTIAIGSPGTLSGVESDGGNFTLNSSSGFLPLNNAFNLIVGNAGSGILGALSVLEANGFAYTLAEPSLTSISGQSATFLAGGEFPVPIRTGGGSDSSITVHFKEYGVRLMLTPTVLDADRIFLKISPEVSELDFNNSVQTGGVSVPGLRVRRTDTSVALGNGESFVISGLVSRNTLSNVDKFPGLGNLP